MNSIEIAFIGRIARDGELRQSQAGKPWCRVSVGVGGDESVQWVGITLFGTLATEMAPRLTRGTRAYIEARDLKLDTYTTQAGEQRHALKAIATRVEVLGAIGQRRPAKLKAPAEGEQRAASATRDWQAPPPEAMPQGGGGRPLDDMIPFGAQVL